MPIYLDVTDAAAETLAKIVAQRSGVSTRYDVTVTTHGGATASVKWSHSCREVTLNLPSLPSDAVLTRAEADRIAGFVVHEACHVLHSDWHAWQTAVRAGPLVQHWANCLEDLRIEALEISRGAYPAMRTLLGKVTDSLLTKALAKGTPGQDLADASYLATIIGRVEGGYPVPSAAGLDKAMSKPVAKLVRHALAKLSACQNTKDVVTLAHRLARMQETQAQAEQAKGDQSKGDQGKGDQGDQSKGDQGDQGDQGTGDQGDQGTGDQGDQGDQGKGDQGKGDQGKDDQGKGDQGESDQGDQGKGDQGEGDQGDQGNPSQGHGDGRTRTPAPTPGPRELLSDLTDLVQAVAKANKVDLGNGSARVTLHGWGIQIVRQWQPGPDPAREAKLRRAYDTMVPGRALLQQEAQRLLTSEEQRQHTHRETSGRLDRRALSRMRAGAVDVFSRKTMKPGRDTALGVLWDLSSSMGDLRTQAVAATAYQLLQAAEGSGASLGVYGFTSDHMGDFTGPSGGLRPIIPFGTHLKEPASVLAAQTSRGGTRLSPCIMGLARIMLDVPANRRVILAITDGDCDYGAELVRQACEVARGWGVEVIGLGIDAPGAVAAFPGRAVNVADLGELAKTGMRVLADALEDGTGD